MPLDRLALRAIDGHVTLTDRRATGWYVLEPQRWSFRSEAEREALVISQAQRLAQLTGRRLHLRVTARPWSVERWARRWTEANPAPLPGWAAALDADQAWLGRLTFADKSVYVGVELSRPAWRWLGAVGRKAEVGQLGAQLAEVAAVVAGAGLEGRPATLAEVEWLLHRSVALGCPPPTTRPYTIPGKWETDDLAEVVGRAEWATVPYGRSVKVVAEVDGRQVTRHVVVLAVGRMGDLPLSPWMAKTDRLAFPVEWSTTIDVLADRAVTKGATQAMLKIRSQVEHWREHRLDPPFSLERARQHSLEVSDDVERGLSGLATRTDTWARLAVTGADEDEALERAREVIDLYSPGVTVVRPPDQYRLAREFIPGEPLSTNAFRRRLPVTTLAVGMAAVAGAVGHEVGDYIGYSSTRDRRAALFDDHRSMEVRERSGLTVLAGGLGAGKSGLLGNILYRSALRGIRWTVLDPSGPLAKLTTLPELAPYSRHINLLDAKPGILNPYRVVPTPKREHYPTEAEWVHQIAMAKATRRGLCSDILQMFLPPQVADTSATVVALANATREVGGEPEHSPREVLEVLAAMDGAGPELAGLLSDKAELPAAQLIFPSGSELDAADSVAQGDDIYLTVITMNGLTLPKENAPRASWSQEEAMAVPLLHLAAWLTQRAIYTGDMAARKGLGMDEVHFLARIASGRALLNQTARYSRKYNTRVVMSTQNVTDLGGADIKNLVDCAFIGRTEDPDAQAAALQLLKIPEGVGYEKEVLGRLSPHVRGAEGRSGMREFVWSDGEGGIERITVDQRGLPKRVRDVLNTSPGSASSPAPELPEPHLNGDEAVVSGEEDAPGPHLNGHDVSGSQPETTSHPEAPAEAVDETTGESVDQTSTPPPSTPSRSSGAEVADDDGELAPRPGWYVDPSGLHLWRWWDGDDWSEHVDGNAPVRKVS